MKLLRLIKLVSVVALLFALVPVLASTNAYAFQETQIAPITNNGDAPENAQKALEADGTNSGADNITGVTGLNAPSIDAKLSEGTDINIPGIGTIGKLPKLDFGLEMLYGLDDKPDVAATPSDEDSPESEVMIRGTVKHRF